ncbi:DUF305 domain-containing protein [Marinivivus vitaminiproducens]|uniref:DUF305 domain-containing protein n=1 Tax=Marinivivus vitaminiproducens TaxID=3035935 RepID=UPI0027A1B973|nr:DUF305 domain-containing protein [Geminicoccaceae bacterium SCSIO 64248]
MPSIAPVLVAVSGAAALLAGMPDARAHSHDRHEHGAVATDSGDMQAAMAPSMDSMMAFQPSGDADADFARLMIPHHQGAIAMAQALLRTSQDPTLRGMADDIIAGQEREIAVLQSWLRDHGR